MLREHAGADLYVLPEIWSAGYFSFDQYAERAESLDGPAISMCRRMARELNAAIHVGSIVERDTGGKLRNTTVLVDADGRIAQVYPNIHVFGYQSLEAELLTPGETLSVVDSPVGRLGSITCYDLRFPGLWQEMSVRGIEAVAIPAAWPATRREHWRLLATARAVEHQVFIVAVNPCGLQRGVELGGCSRVVDPSGHVLAECSDDELAAIGVSPPPEVPMFYPLDASTVNSASEYADSEYLTSGEIKPVYVRHGGIYYLGVGSNHTDRDLERSDIGDSKRACPKPVSRHVIRISDAADLSDFSLDDGDDFVCLGGALPLLDGGFARDEQWHVEIELADGTRLAHDYRMKGHAARQFRITPSPTATSVTPSPTAATRAVDSWPSR